MSTVNNQLNTGATPIAVSQGGIGTTTLTTAYAPVCGGTSATSNLQPASGGLGTSGYILCSNGSSALPSFEQQPIQTASVTLSTANIEAMYATPVQILAPQGAHTVIAVYNIIMEYIYNSTPFSAGGTIYIQYNNSAHAGGIQIWQPLISITTSGSKIVYGGASDFLDGTYGVQGAIVNQGLYISNLSAAYTTGNSSAKITVYYIVLPTTV
jgi:hypothetical protein